MHMPLNIETHTTACVATCASMHTKISWGDMDFLESAQTGGLTLPSTSVMTQSILLHGLTAHLAAVEALQSWELSKAIWD